MQKRHVFPCSKLAAACRKAEEDGKAVLEAAEAEKDPKLRLRRRFEADLEVFGKVFSADLGKARPSSGCHWVNVQATDIDGVTAPPIVRFKDHAVGTIKPATEEELSKINARRSQYGLGTIDKPRNGPSDSPQVQINLYKNGDLQLEEDGLTFKKDEDGNPLVPEETSELCYFALCYNRWFRAFMWKSKKDGMVYGLDDEEAMSGSPPSKALGVSKTNVVQMVQTAISRNAKKNAGVALPNPIFRFKLRLDKNGVNFDKSVSIHDGSKGSINPKTRKPEFELLVDDKGTPANNYNIHELIPSGSALYGIVKMDSICFSNMGISVPCNAQLLVVSQAKGAGKITQDDLDMGDLPEDMRALLKERKEDAAPAPDVSPVAVGGSPPPENKSSSAPAEENEPYVSEENLDDILDLA